MKATHHPCFFMEQVADRVVTPSKPETKVFETLKVWSSRFAARQHMKELDDRLLEDAGLTRADVDREASKPVWRA